MNPQASHRPVAVVTDSAACVPPDLLAELDIAVVPFVLLWDGEAYTDGDGMAPETFYRRFAESSTYPTTTQPPLGAFIEVYRKLASRVSGIVSIHIPSKLSSAVRVAEVATREIASSGVNVPVRVVDCGTASAAEAFVALAAARAAKGGADLDTVEATARDCAGRVGMPVALATLEHLHRGGRIGEAAALLGTRLRVQPIICLEDGRLKPVGVTRRRRQVYRILVDQVARAVDNKPIRAAVLHSAVPDEAQRLARMVKKRFHPIEFFVAPLTPVMGAHTGPGTLGIAYCLESDDA